MLIILYRLKVKDIVKFFDKHVMHISKVSTVEYRLYYTFVDFEAVLVPDPCVDIGLGVPGDAVAGIFVPGKDVDGAGAT